jgi:molecular chaperone Hsp33
MAKDDSKGLYLQGQNDNGFIEADDNVVQTFQLESSNLRGRVVRLGSVLDDIIKAHDYPDVVSHLTAETITLSALLSSMLKYEGIFTLQAQGDGPVGMLVADMTSAGIIRGCAHYNEEKLPKMLELIEGLGGPASSENYFAHCLGKGHLAFTVDQEGSDGRYQGIVDLKGAALIDCVQHYFTQSEQIGTDIKMAVGQVRGKWRAGAIMLQRMPEADKGPKSNTIEDDWRRAMVLLGTATDKEFLDPDMHSNELLTRLFHEEGVRVFAPQDIQKGCRCSREKVENVLRMMPADDMEFMKVNGEITMTCEFCSRDFVFDGAEIKRTIAGKESGSNKQE